MDARVCVHSLMREIENETALTGYTCQNSTETQLIDFSSHSSELGSPSRPWAHSFLMLL